MKHIFRTLSISCMALLLGSCIPKNIVYFQDRFEGEFVAGTNAKHFKLRPEDQISIYVKSRNQSLAQLFNTGMSGYIDTGSGRGSNMNMMGGGTQGYGGSIYTIDHDGNIDFPILGKLHVEGMNRMEIASMVTDSLRNSGQVEDAIVTVSYVNLYANIIGEMGHQRLPILDDRYNLVDLVTENEINFNGGKRHNVTVTRDSCGIKKTYIVDFTNLRGVYDSPVYYIHPDDLIYCEPRNMRVRETTAAGNFFMNYGFWLGVPSMILSLIAVIKR